jgi:putative membrane protein
MFDLQFFYLQPLSVGYGSVLFVLGFALVFRSSQGYSRYWDGANLLRQMRTEWHDACSQVCAFCMTSDKSPAEKHAFMSCMVRLFSLMHCLALQQVADMEDDSFEVIDLESLDPKLIQSLSNFQEPLEKTEVVCQWIQRVILEGAKNGMVPTPPPIVSRVFQEINSGMVCLSRLQAITDHPFPFPYAQMIAAMLGIHWLLTPLLIGMLPAHFGFCAVFAFISVFSMCALNLIAQEIENPFGDDANDLHIDHAQHEMNDALLLLLSDAALMVPNYSTVARLTSCSDTHRLSVYMPLTKTSSRPIAGTVSSDTVHQRSSRTSYVSDRNSKLSSKLKTSNQSRTEHAQESRDLEPGEPPDDLVPSEPVGRRPVTGVNAGNDAGPAAVEVPAATRVTFANPGISMTEITNPTDFRLQLEESAKRIEKLENQSNSHFREMYNHYNLYNVMQQWSTFNTMVAHTQAAQQMDPRGAPPVSPRSHASMAQYPQASPKGDGLTNHSHPVSSVHPQTSPSGDASKYHPQGSPGDQSPWAGITPCCPPSMSAVPGSYPAMPAYHQLSAAPVWMAQSALPVTPRI